MGIARRAQVIRRGPVRSSLRAWQARHPRLAPGHIGPPDFVGIGAQRCGTSWWHSLIEQHPRVAGLGWGMKELHYFDDHWRATGRPLQDYAVHFRRPTGRMVGEWTPRYMWDPWAVPALLRVAPEAKLLVMVRDPLARLASGVQHAVKLHGEPTADDVNEAISRGMYAEQVEPVLQLVDAGQLLVLQLEQCVREQGRLLDRTFEFLGLEPHQARRAGERNESVAAPVPLDPTLMEAVRHRYAEDAQRLAALCPGSIDLELWPSLFGGR